MYQRRSRERRKPHLGYYPRRTQKETPKPARSTSECTSYPKSEAVDDCLEVDFGETSNSESDLYRKDSLLFWCGRWDRLSPEEAVP